MRAATVMRIAVHVVIAVVVVGFIAAIWGL